MDDETQRLWHSASNADKGNYFEFVIEQLITYACKSATCVIDAGANYGAHTVTMLHNVKPNTPVVAFEPNPHLKSALEKWRDVYPNLDVRHIALSDRSGNAEFLVASDAGYGSLYSRPQFNIAVSERVNVATARLDDFLEFRTTSPVSFIKADVEGSEIAFLHGAKETLRQSRPIVVMELDWNFTLPTPRDSAEKLFGYLDSVGYAVYDFSGKELRRRDADAWNVLLLPHERDPSPIRAICLSAGETFFRDYRGWNPYKKFETALSPFDDKKPSAPRAIVVSRT